MFLEGEEDRAITATDASKLLEAELPLLDFCAATVHRWWTYGLRLRDGTRILLKTDRFGGRILTRISYLREFLTILAEDNARRVPPQPVVPPESPKKRRGRPRKTADSAAKLDAIGIK